MIEPLRELSAPTLALSAYIAYALEQPLPAPVLEKARQHILDTVAAMISGSHLVPGRLAIEYVAALGGTRQSSIVGTRLLTSPVHAALANGMLAHADETDDSHAPSRTHPGCAVIPAALGVAEAKNANGDQLIKAVVLGYDVASRINYALGPDALAAQSRSTHSVGGTFGAGAAAGALLKLDARQARHLLSFCAQQASGISSNVRDPDHIEKAFDFGGMPARNGVAAATMVAAGMTGVDDVFAGERNFFQAYAAQPDLAQLSSELGVRFEILGTNIKKWPVGSPAQAALDALTALMDEHGIGAGDIAGLDVHLPARSTRTVDNAPSPELNVQHLLALLLIDKTLSFESIHDRDRMVDPAVLGIRRKIALIPSEELALAKPARQAIVAVKTEDGRELSHRTLAVRGTADNPMTQAEIEVKAFDLIETVLGARRAKAILRAIASLETAADVAELRRLWQPAYETRPGPRA
ncbi:MAG TPA: MmgE/PrpD family protein [Micropepsaceae bacterium]|nr:MmgE/PrpD family protein [Micropepsaceae bacterium]